MSNLKNKITVDDFMTYVDERLRYNNDMYYWTLDGLIMSFYDEALDDIVEIEISTNEWK